MKKFISLAAIVALAACTQAETEEAGGVEGDALVEGGVDAGFEAVAPGDYEIARADGTTDQLTIHPGLTWSSVFSDGNAAGGTIFAQAGKDCFVTEGEEGHICFEAGELAEDGSIQVTASDGETMTVTPVDSFADAPSSAESEDEAAGETGE